LMGEFRFDVDQSTVTTSSDQVYVSLEAVAPVALTLGTVKFSTTGTNDADTTCTGTASAPTAPAGNVCTYATSSGGITLSTLEGFQGTFARRDLRQQRTAGTNTSMRPGRTPHPEIDHPPQTNTINKPQPTFAQQPRTRQTDTSAPTHRSAPISAVYAERHERSGMTSNFRFSAQGGPRTSRTVHQTPSPHCSLQARPQQRFESGRSYSTANSIIERFSLCALD
jgi:hypothetical protein